MLRPLLIISSMFLIGPLLVVAGAAIIRRIIPMMPLPNALVVSQAAITLFAMARAPTEIFIPNIPFDDVYVAYFYVPGPHIYVLALLISGAVLKFTFSSLLYTLPYHLASVVAIVVLPGIVGLIIGTVQWFLLGLAWQAMASRAPNVKGTIRVKPTSPRLRGEVGAKRRVMAQS